MGASVEMVRAFAAAGESATLEFKKSTAEKERACRTLCAFANGHGGRVLFGITPAGKVAGQTVTDRALEELAQEFQGFEPPLFPSVERVSIDDGREVLVLTAPRAARAPVAFRGVAYERVLNTTRTMPRETYQRLLLKEMYATERWENQPAAGWDVSRLDRREMVLTLEESIRRGRVDDPGTREPLEILRGLGLLVDGDKARGRRWCFFDWHLHEARRLLADLDAPPELSAAIRFDAWLRDEALRTGDLRIVSARIYQYGPGCVRDSKALKAALALLDERGRARVAQEGRHRFVVVNPALLAGLPAGA